MLEFDIGTRPSKHRLGIMADRHFELDGLLGQVEVILDKWGIPHIYATDRGDMFVAQGFMAAYHRLFQMDLWRRWGLGRLAEVLGEQYVARDRAARLFVYRGDMRAEWLAYGSDMKRIAKAFTQGVNAFIDTCVGLPELLPEEFDLLGYQPSYWSPEDIVRIRVHGLHANLEREVLRARVMRRFGPEVDDLRFVREPGDPLNDVIDDIVAKAIDEDVLAVYRLAITPPPIIGQNSNTAEFEHSSGSNNWVVAGDRTATGRPILANDPHRALTVPSLRFVTHLVGPDCNVIGAGEPGIPGVSIGHNERLAFGLTILPVDQEDLYVYRIDSEHPGRYWYRGAWEAFEVREEHVDVRDSSPEPIALKFSRHGPVIYESIERGVACTARVAWLEPGMAPYLGSVEYMNAAGMNEFVTAMDRWGAPGENQVFADVAGNIGYKPGGMIPRRKTWSGLMPVPGDGRYEWDGFVEPGVIEGQRNPARGWCATANQRTVTWQEWESADRFCYEWSAEYRFRRISDVLDTASRLGIEDCQALQLDVRSLPAVAMLNALRAILGPKGCTGEEAQWAWAELSDWDGAMEADSRAAAVFEVWHRRFFRPALLRWALRSQVAPEDLDEAVELLLPDESLSGDSRVDVSLVQSGSWNQEELRGLATATLEAAVGYLRGKLGADRESWCWGRLHVAAPRHAIEFLARGDTSAWALPEVERGGNGETVQATASGLDFRQTSGASFRMVVDVGDWDASVFVNAPGQSGRPRDPHYSDHWRAWAEGKYLPMLFSRAAVEDACEARVILEKKGIVPDR